MKEIHDLISAARRADKVIRYLSNRCGIGNYSRAAEELAKAVTAMEARLRMDGAYTYTESAVRSTGRITEGDL